MTCKWPLIMTINNKIRSPWRYSLLALPLALGATACSPSSSEQAAAPEITQQRLSSTLPGILSNLGDATAFLNDSNTLAALGDSFGSLDNIFGAPDGTSGEPLPAAGDEPMTGQEIADMLEQELFNEANYEGNGDYMIPTSLLCPDIEVYDDTSPSGYIAQTDQECIDDVTLIEPRVHVETAGNGLDLSLLIGPQKAIALSLELREDSIAVVADLAEAKAAATHITNVLGEDLDIPTTIEGVAVAKLTVNGPEDISLSLSIREAINIAGALPPLGDITFSSAVADPFLALRVSAPAQQLTAFLNLGRTQASMPFDSFNPDSVLTDLLALDWQGVSGSVELSDAIPNAAIEVSNIGFGDGQSTIKLGNATLLAVDLNADAGRRFALSIVPGIAGALQSFHFDPGFLLQVAIDLSPLADAGEDVPPFALGETYRIEVESGAQPVETATASGLMALDGAIRIRSSVGSSNIEVAEGQCLLPSEVTSGEHELLGSLEAGACPQ